tara:strand:+ start:543 stop:2192 length:1650 start_codon:yes stop_codon:yes gene_type:complete
MATHDYVLDNASGAAFRTDLNNALAAIVSNNSNNSSPSTTYAYQWWADTSNNVLKIRNSANNDWIELLQLDGTITLEDGSVSTPALAFRDDLNTGIFSSAADTFNVATGGVERMELGATTIFNESGADVDFRIESSGTANMFYLDAGNNRIGLNRATPIEMFEVGGNIYLTSNSSNANDGNALKFQSKTGGFDTSYGAAIYGLRVGDTSSYLRFDTGGQSEKMRLDSSGRLLVGTSSARSIFKMGASGNGQTPTFQFETANDDSNNSLSLTYGRNNAFGAEIFIAKHRTATVGGTTVVQSGDRLGGLTFAGSDGTNFQPAALIQALVDGTPGTDDMPGVLTFSTTADGAKIPTERVRITNAGKFYVGTIDGAFGNNAAQHGCIKNGTATEYTLSLRNTVDSSDGRTLLCACGKSTGGRLIFFERADGTTVGSITHDGSSTSYGTSSDYRLKENAVAISDGITRLKTLKPYKFNWKIDETNTPVDGFFAHEITAVPEAVTGTKDEVDSESKPVYQTIDQSKLVPLLTAALQEAVGKIEVLETKVAALEAA